MGKCTQINIKEMTKKWLLTSKTPPHSIRGHQLMSWKSNKRDVGTSLAVQRLRPHASTAGGMGSIPGRGTEIPHALWHSQ